MATAWPRLCPCVPVAFTGAAPASVDLLLLCAGNHYTVTLTDPSHTCTCPDYRFRRHDCKHISLCLQQLGVFERPHPEVRWPPCDSINWAQRMAATCQPTHPPPARAAAVEGGSGGAYV
jgi:hypothetical protein